MLNFNPSSLVESVPVRAVAPPVQISNAQNRRMIEARFDNQFTTEENRELWALSDVMSVDAMANYMVRRTLRMRSRYAYHNNPFFMGAANRLAKFVIGTGPVLHMNTKNPKVNAAVEDAWRKWSKKIRLARKLRTSRAARFYNGEGFFLLRTNPKIRHPVKLDLFEIEADQVTSPMFGLYPTNYPDQFFDGLVLDPWGNPQTYHVLRQHPGAFGAFLLTGTEFDPWPARYVLHDFGSLRPAQQRGIPESTPALDLFEELRRGRKAVVAAWETAADYAGFIKTNTPPGSDDDDPDELETGFGTETDYVNIKRRKMGVLPEGWDAYQMKAEQPTTTYDMFTMTTLVEISQVLDMPLFILAGDARLANMASAYVASQSFINSVTVDREDYEVLLDKGLDEWVEEARRIPGLLPREAMDMEMDHSWRWPRVHAHADPAKMATAQNQRMKNGVSCPSIECAAEGNTDFDEVCERAASDFGITPDEYRAALFQSLYAEKGTPPPASLDPETGRAPSNPDPEDED